VYAWGGYGDPLRAAVTAWKDEGRRDLVAVLAPALAEALTVALRGIGDSGMAPLVVPAPSSARSRRVRGDIPLNALVTRSVAGLAARAVLLAPALDEGRHVRDQAGLGTSARLANVSGAFTVRRRCRPLVAGRDCVVVDDLMTTGATLAECARALGEAGAADVLGVTIAAARRRRGGSRRMPAPAAPPVGITGHPVSWSLPPDRIDG
ncbi:MAG: hypothetical protein L0H79_07475, partial [Intrasporangium sp.]|uniref:ComF family protein n=1 Tax=Intrasporangium sp. TaxID=1925024 RepID=UPI0026474685